MSKLLRIGGSLVYNNAAKTSIQHTASVTSPLVKSGATRPQSLFYKNQQYRVYASSSSTLNQTNQPRVENKSETFLNGSTANYTEEIYMAWLQDPKSVHKSWDIFFRTNSVQQPSTLGMEKATAAHVAPSAGQAQHLVAASSNSSELNTILALLQQMSQNLGNFPSNANTHRYAPSTMLPSSPEEKLVEDHLKLYALIRSYQIRGHKKANLDPLAIGKSLDVTTEHAIPEDLTPEFYNFTAEDMNREFKLPATTFIGGNEPVLTLAEILSRLNKVVKKLDYNR